MPKKKSKQADFPKRIYVQWENNVNDGLIASKSAERAVDRELDYLNADAGENVAVYELVNRVKLTRHVTVTETQL